MTALEAEFVKIAKSYSERQGIAGSTRRTLVGGLGFCVLGR